MTEVRRKETFYVLYDENGQWHYVPYDNGKYYRNFKSLKNAEEWITIARRSLLSKKFLIEKRTEIDEVFEY